MILPRAARRRAFRAIALTVLGLAIAGPARAAEGDAALPNDPLAGRRVFLEKGCNNCHAIWGQGGSLGPDLGTSTAWRSVTQLSGILWNHSPEMIEKMRERRMARPMVSTGEMADLAAFLYFLNYFDPPGDPEKGAVVFAQKGCSRCHSVGGGGGSVGPALDAYKSFASPLFLVRAMWSHGPAMLRKMEENRIPRPKFVGRELADIFSYLQKASTEKSAQKVYMAVGSPARGEKVFADKGCARCHAVWGSGGHIGPDLGEKEVHTSVSEIAGSMWNHGPTMWEKMAELKIPLSRFSDTELSDLIAYVFFLQYFDPRGDIVKGQAVFVDKGCILCHYAPHGAEKLLAPDLTHSSALSSPLALASAMWNHAPAMEAQFRERGLPWPRFQGDEVRDLVSYLRSRQTAQ